VKKRGWGPRQQAVAVNRPSVAVRVGGQRSDRGRGKLAGGASAQFWPVDSIQV
jgi:hypothetical protein